MSYSYLQIDPMNKEDNDTRLGSTKYKWNSHYNYVKQQKTVTFPQITVMYVVCTYFINAVISLELE